MNSTLEFPPLKVMGSWFPGLSRFHPTQVACRALPRLWSLLLEVIWGESPFYGRSNMWNMIIHGWSLAPIATVARFPAPSALAPVHVFHAHHDCLRGFGLGTAHGIYFRHFLNLELFDLGQLKSYQSLRQVLGGNYAASTVPTKLFRLKASKLHRALNHLVIWQSLQGQLLHEFNRWMDKNTIAIAHCIFIPVIPKPALGVLQMFFPSTATISMKWPESYGFVWK